VNNTEPMHKVTRFRQTSARKRPTRNDLRRNAARVTRQAERAGVTL
jgi:hypothetical protein